MIYLDNAATSFPKPPTVIDEVARCMREYCGNAGRGSHSLAMAAAEKIYDCRALAANLFCAESPERVCFTPNTTAALNAVIKGWLSPGDHVLISDLEHNAVYRPICQLSKTRGISFDVFPTFASDPDTTGDWICRAVRRRIKKETRMLIATHASNVCGFCMPIEQLGGLCREAGILFVVDGAQSAGHLPIDMEKYRIDALCLPGHKGLLGPQGSGMLILGNDLPLQTLLEGGSGYHSLDWEMPLELPERLEAGTLATPAIAGLFEGIQEVKRMGVEEIGRHVTALHEELFSRLRSIGGIHFCAPRHRGGVLSFNIEGYRSEEVAKRLDRMGICVRAGFHCSALAHRTLGTTGSGCVRVSAGPYTTQQEINALIDAVREIALSKKQ